MRQYYKDTIATVDSGGDLVPLNAVEVHVYNAGTTVHATIYGSRNPADLTPLANPLTTGSTGFVEFWANAGEYDIKLHDTITPARIADKTYGWGSLTSDDPRLSDARPPTAHAASHAVGGGDAVSLPFQVSHNFLISGPVAVPSGQLDVIPPISIPVVAGDTVKLARVRFRLNNGAAGTTVSFKIQKNGSDIAGFGTTGSPLVTGTNTNWNETDPADVTLADNDSLQLVVTAISGSPQNLSVSLILEHRV